jgi:hypothetical protein
MVAILTNETAPWPTVAAQRYRPVPNEEEKRLERAPADELISVLWPDKAPIPTDGSTFATADPHVTAQQVATSVPEPSALMLVLIGATGMAAFARLRRSKATSLHKQPTSAGCPPHWRA